MDRKNAWIIGLCIILGAIVLGFLQSWLPLPSNYDPYQYQIGRYQNMTWDEGASELWILDTVTGDVFAVDKTTGTSRLVRRGN